MPQSNKTITINFVPKGDKKLIEAFRGLGKAQGGLNETTDKSDKKLKKYGKTQQRVTESTGLLGNAFSVIRSKMLLFSFAMAMGTRQLIDFTKKAAKIEAMGLAFNTLSGGSEKASISMTKLKAATNGTMSEMDLFQQANNAMILGITKNSDEMAEMFDIAQRLGRALGVDTKRSVESLVTGIGRQSRLMLDNIGIIVKADEAYGEYAEKLGTTADKLSDAEKKQAFLIATMESARKKVGSLNEEILGLQDTYDKLGASADNATTELGEFIAKVFSLSKSGGVISDSIGMFGHWIKMHNDFIDGSQEMSENIDTTIDDFIRLRKAMEFAGEFDDTGGFKEFFFGSDRFRKGVRKSAEELGIFKNSSIELGQSYEMVGNWIIASNNKVSEGTAASTGLQEMFIKMLGKTKAGRLAEKEATLAALEAHMELKGVDEDLLLLHTQLEAQIYSLSGAKKADADAEKELNEQRKRALSLIDDAQSNLMSLLTTEQEQLAAQEELALAQANLFFIEEERLNAISMIKDHFVDLEDERILRQEQQYIKKLEDSSAFYSSSMAGYDQFVTSLTDMDMDGKTRREVIWEATRSSLIKFMGEYLKQLIISKIAQEGVAAAGQTAAIASSVVTGQSIALAYAAASAAASLASFGANAIPAAAGIASTHALTESLAAFEQGGLVGGRRHSSGGTMIEAEKGEFVMSRNAVDSIGLEAMNRINAGGGGGSVSINFTGNVMSQDFIEDEAIPMIKEAVRRGADIGVA